MIPGGDALADTPAGIFARLAAEVALGGLEPAPLLGAAQTSAAAARRRSRRACPRGRGTRARGVARAAPAPRIGRACARTRDLPADARQAAPQRSASADARRRTRCRRTPDRQSSRWRSPRWKPGRNQTSLLTLAQAPRQSDRDARGRRRSGSPPMAASTAGNCSARSKRSSKAQSVADSLELNAATIRTCSIRFARAAPSAARKSAVRACASSGCWKRGCRASIASCSAGSMKAAGHPTRAAIPGSSRPMRLELGLNLPELRVGLSAHDFAQGLGAPEVILTRAGKQSGAPTVRSRFVQRLAAVAGETDGSRRWQRGAALYGLRARARSSRRSVARCRGRSRCRRRKRGPHS